MPRIASAWPEPNLTFIPEYGNFANDPLQLTSSLVAIRNHQFMRVQSVECRVSYLISLALLPFFVFR